MDQYQCRGKLSSGHVRPRQGKEICNFGAPSPLEALHWIFCFFSSIYVQFCKTSPLKSGESSEKSSGENRVKSCHVCGCHGFFGPDFEELSGPLVHTNFPRKRNGPMVGPYEFPPKLVWTNGAQSSLKVSVLTGIGPWSALPCVPIGAYHTKTLMGCLKP